jgi:hypothetical protein
MFYRIVILDYRSFIEETPNRLTTNKTKLDYPFPLKIEMVMFHQHWKRERERERERGKRESLGERGG